MKHQHDLLGNMLHEDGEGKRWRWRDMEERHIRNVIAWLGSYVENRTHRAHEPIIHQCIQRALNKRAGMMEFMSLSEKLGIEPSDLMVGQLDLLAD